MATRKAAPAPAPLFSDLDALLDSAEVEKRKTGTKDRYLSADQVPEKYSTLAQKLHDEKSRVKIPVSSKETFAQLHKLFASAAHHLGYSANVRSVFTGEGDDAKLIGASITVSDKRGSGKAADTASEDAE